MHLARIKIVAVLLSASTIARAEQPVVGWAPAPDIQCDVPIYSPLVVLARWATVEDTAPQFALVERPTLYNLNVQTGVSLAWETVGEAVGVASADVTGDGVDDIVMSQMVNDGSVVGIVGASAPSDAGSLLPFDDSPSGEVVRRLGDMDNDEREDVLVGGHMFFGQSVSPWLAKAQPAIEFERAYGRVYEVGDVSGDGVDDVLIPDWSSGAGYTNLFGGMTLSTYNDGMFQQLAFIEPTGTLALVGIAGAGTDADHDGVNEVVLIAADMSEGGFSEGEVWWLKLDADGSVRELGALEYGLAAGLGGYSANGWQEIFSLSDGAVAWFNGTRVTELVLGGSTPIAEVGRWEPPPDVAIIDGIVADMNDDGELDIVALVADTYFVEPRVVVWLRGTLDRGEIAYCGNDGTPGPDGDASSDETQIECGCSNSSLTNETAPGAIGFLLMIWMMARRRVPFMLCLVGSVGCENDGADATQDGGEATSEEVPYQEANITGLSVSCYGGVADHSADITGDPSWVSLGLILTGVSPPPEDEVHLMSREDREESIWRVQLQTIGIDEPLVHGSLTHFTCDELASTTRVAMALDQRNEVLDCVVRGGDSEGFLNGMYSDAAHGTEAESLALENCRIADR